MSLHHAPLADDATELYVLSDLIREIQEPGQEGEPLAGIDYVMLLVATIAVPAALIVIGAFL